MMKLLTILSIMLVAVKSNEEVYEEIDDLSDDLNADDTSYHLKTAADIVYHFYCRKHPRNTFDVDINDVELLRNSDFSARKDTWFIVHGWKNNNESSVNHQIREKILRHYDINVIVVDWRVMAGKNYVSAKIAVERVGIYLAEFILELKKLFGLKLSKVNFVGHSLGAHICGNAGAALNGEVNTIVGLDPAGPLFTLKNKDNRLDADDARFVQVIHTSSYLGFGQAIGDADFFPNGGSSQPGCGWDLLGSCAHSRSYALYAESLESKGFIGTQCDSYDDFISDLCSLDRQKDQSVMGGFKLDYRANGSYFLLTNEHSPYAMW